MRFIDFVVSAVSLATLAIAKADGSPTTLTKTSVFVSGQGGYHTYRIPSLLVTARGTLLAFAEGRKGGRGDAGDIDVLLRRSADQGKIWQPIPHHLLG